MATNVKRAYIIVPMIIVSLVLIYGIAAFVIIPKYIKDPTREQKAEDYIGYGLTIATTIAWTGVTIAQYLDLKKKIDI